MAIYDFLSWVFTRGKQIAEFVNAMLDAVMAIAKGDVSGVAGLVEGALARSVPVLIGMLASLLGISDLAEKVQNVIRKIRDRIESAITKLLDKARGLVGKLLGKGKKGGEDEEGKDGKKKDDLPENPKERLDLGMKAATAAVNRIPDRHVTHAAIVSELETIKLRYGFQTLEPYAQGKHWWIKGKVNPEATAETSRDSGTTPASSYKTGDLVKTRYIDGWWVAEITKWSDSSVEIEFLDRRKGSRFFTREDFDEQVAEDQIKTYISDRRGMFMGSNPSRNSEFGDRLKDRYRANELFRIWNGRQQIKFPENESGTWYYVDDCDLSHEPMDAVTYWNTIGYKYGPRSPEVREFMTNPKNYIFEPRSINRSRSSREGETYRDPYKD
jgi:hypothetical protein